MTTLINNIFDSLVPQDTEFNKALKQGQEFKKYQKRIAKNTHVHTNTRVREGFSTEPTYFAKKSQSVLDQNKLNETDNADLESLKNQYNMLLGQVQELEKRNMSDTKNYLEIIDPNNKFHNANVRLNNNQDLGYVTNKGVYKLFHSEEISKNTEGKNGCPSKTMATSFSSSGLNTPGTIIDSNPALMVGTPMKPGQSCGHEGDNVFVDSILPTNIEAKYSGCYTDNPGSSSMTFIGGSPPPQGAIVNGNFEQPSISSNSYEYINSSSKVPGWNFNAVLINNSSAWGFPIPYPSGNQCACIQMDQTFSQTLDLGTGKYTLTFFAVGRNCCDTSRAGQSNAVAIKLNDTTIQWVQPPVEKWTSYSINFDVSSTGKNILTFQGGWTFSDLSTAFQNISISGGDSTNGKYTYNMCKDAAVSGGYRYFALQGVNPQTSTGYCAVSNDSVGATSKGNAYIVSGGITLWSSETKGKTGCTAILTNQGALSVVQNNTSVFSTPNANANPSDYLGCYGDGDGDGDGRAMPLYNNGGQEYNRDQCRDIAQKSGAKYFGLQNSTSGTNAQCAFGDDLGKIMQYGKAGNCTQLSDGSYSGGGWSNAVYSVNASSVYFLMLLDDGNMCIYRGSGPDDNQGFIWCTGTNGKQQKPNPRYAAAKGKYGKNYMNSGATLAAGDFVGSTDGSIYLIMQHDGNLVLYTSQNALNCTKISDNIMGGGVGANALYDLGTTGFPSNVGKIGYVDDDGNLSEYPTSMKGLSTSYSKFPNSDTTGNDIGEPILNSTVDSCKTKCDSMDDCGGYVFDTNQQTCYPKNKKMYPNSSKIAKTGVDIYLRQPSITEYPGSSKNMATIDSIQWKNYQNTGKPVSAATFGNSGVLTNTEKQALDQMRGRLNLLAQQITGKTNQLLNKNTNVNNQLLTNKTNFKNNASDFTEITSMDQTGKLNNINEIVKDTDIVTLQENYRYIMWSVLAIGVVSLSLTILKKT